MPEPRTADIRTLRKVAKWFYDEQRSKEFIAESLVERFGKKIDSRYVGWMLDRARQLGLVRIEFPKPAQESDLERKLRERFKLLKVVAVPIIDGEQYTDLVARWAEGAARYFDQLVAEGGELHVGIGGGETLLSFTNAVREYPRKNVFVHTTALVGRSQLGEETFHIDPLVNATILWTKCGRLPGHCHYATVPPCGATDREGITSEINLLARRPPIRDVIYDMDKINVAFVGLGLVNPTERKGRNQLTMTGLLEAIVTPDQLEEEGAVGDISCCLFGPDGKENPKHNWRFFLTPGHYDPGRQGVEFFRRMVSERKPVVVIAGMLKERALAAALEGKLFNVLFTDEDTARTLLRRTRRRTTRS